MQTRPAQPFREQAWCAWESREGAGLRARGRPWIGREEQGWRRRSGFYLCKCHLRRFVLPQVGEPRWRHLSSICEKLLRQKQRNVVVGTDQMIFMDIRYKKLSGLCGNFVNFDTFFVRLVMVDNA